MIFRASASVNVSFAPGAVFASKKHFFTLRKVSKATLSFAFIAFLMSSLTFSNKSICIVYLL